MGQGVNRTRLNNRTDDKPNASFAPAISEARLWERYGATAAVCDVSFEARGPSSEDVFIELTGRPWSAGEPHGEVS
jgi:hypothetical protein